MEFELTVIHIIVSIAVHRKIECKIAGELFGVEKVKPDPLNLLVKTDVGSNRNSIFIC
jgi:hypothetical protein